MGTWTVNRRWATPSHLVVLEGSEWVDVDLCVDSPSPLPTHKWSGYWRDTTRNYKLSSREKQEQQQQKWWQLTHHGDAVVCCSVAVCFMLSCCVLPWCGGIARQFLTTFSDNVHLIRKSRLSEKVIRKCVIRDGRFWQRKKQIFGFISEMAISEKRILTA